MLKIKPPAAVREARMLPLCYAAPLPFYNLFSVRIGKKEFTKNLSYAAWTGICEAFMVLFDMIV